MSEDGKKNAETDAADEEKKTDGEEVKAEAKSNEKSNDKPEAETESEESPEASEEAAEESTPLTPKQAWEKREFELAKELAVEFELGEFSYFRNQVEFTVKAEKLRDFVTGLKTDERYQFVQLMDVTAVDYLKLEGDNPERFAVIYYLFSALHNARIRVRVWVDEDEPSVPTLSDIFGSANWGEREVYDMFGIEFSDHPNLIRILMPTDFGSHPLRKDYPLRGRGERDDFPRIRRGGKHDL